MSLNQSGSALPRARRVLAAGGARGVSLTLKLLAQTSLTGPFEWLRQNPDRMHLGRIGFDLPGPREIEVDGAEQTLDLWGGLLTSRFAVAGQSVEVRTCCHPAIDVLALRVRSPLLRDGRLAIWSRSRIRRRSARWRTGRRRCARDAHQRRREED